ncbi:hypothetical protein I7I48_00313 [Histoplasma ohiense]|nr:hypothetical protein I7I48_00313 [Histoplasma ohiense (nom. inval.)]
MLRDSHSKRETPIRIKLQAQRPIAFRPELTRLLLEGCSGSSGASGASFISFLSVKRFKPSPSIVSSGATSAIWFHEKSVFFPP